MADPVLQPGRSGVQDGPPGVTVRMRPDLAILSLAAGKGRKAALAARLLERHGLTLSNGSRFVVGTALSAVGIGPERWLLLRETKDSDFLRRQVSTDLEGLGAVADLSDAFQVLRLLGPSARAVLAKGLPIDLHPSVFGPGDAASSLAVLIPLHLWQLDEAPTYEIAVPRSMASSFATWLKDSAAEFGLLVKP